VLDLDDSFDARPAENMLAVRDDRASQRIDADGAVFLAFDVELEGLLEDRAVLVVENDDLLIIQELQQVVNALPAESPMVAPVRRWISDANHPFHFCADLHLAQTQQAFQDTLEPALLTKLGALLILRKHALGLRSASSLACLPC
jgi:hypothetical protein